MSERTDSSRSTLRIADLKGRPAHSGSRLMNVKVPPFITEEVNVIAKKLDASKVDVVTALLNEGLAIAARHSKKA